MFGRSFCFWAVGPDLGGQSAWGYPDGCDADEYIASLEAAAAARARWPRSIVVSLSELAGVTDDAFLRVRDHIRANPELTEVSSIIVRPGGVLGAAVAGFHQVALGSSAKPVVETFAEACAMVGRPDLVGLPERLRALRDGAPAVIIKLRRALRGEAPPASLTSASRALAISSRSLQRILKESGTTFRAERDRARLERALRLVATGGKLIGVAHELGFSSAQAFATWFKRMTGKTPSDSRDSE